MFTGIIQSIGEIVALESRGGDARLRVRTGQLDLSDVALGDSIAVSGVCLTAVDLPGDGFGADVSAETVSRTLFKNVRRGSRVNLEKALTLSSHLGGHWVSGHVDGVGTILSRHPSARSVRFSIAAPVSLACYIAEKGSICVDGVSLTINSVNRSIFEINIVPHTLTQTTLNDCASGQEVNLEVDVVARYLERLLLGERASSPTSSGISKELLAEAGFLK